MEHRPKSRLALFLLVMAMLVVTVTPASAITDGELDGDDHPNVVLLLMDVGGSPAFRCTATMIAPTVALTAGHCTSNFPGDPYTGMRIFYESDVENGDNTYPAAGGPNSIEAVSWSAHPLYETAPFFFHDVGVVVLESAIPGLTEFGTLPGQDDLDDLKTRGKKAQFRSVGYGLQAAQLNNPTAQAHTVGVKIRMAADTRLIQINVPGSTGDFAMILTNNAKTGGTCFGDSGGPNFLGDTNVVAGITSFGKNANCAGQGGVFRTDRVDVLNYVNSYLP